MHVEPGFYWVRVKHPNIEEHFTWRLGEVDTTSSGSQIIDIMHLYYSISLDEVWQWGPRVYPPGKEPSNGEK